MWILPHRGSRWGIHYQLRLPGTSTASTSHLSDRSRWDSSSQPRVKQRQSQPQNLSWSQTPDPSQGQSLSTGPPRCQRCLSSPCQNQRRSTGSLSFGPWNQLPPMSPPLNYFLLNPFHSIPTQSLPISCPSCCSHPLHWHSPHPWTHLLCSFAPPLLLITRLHLPLGSWLHLGLSACIGSVLHRLYCDLGYCDFLASGCVSALHPFSSAGLLLPSSSSYVLTPVFRDPVSTLVRRPWTSGPAISP